MSSDVVDLARRGHDAFSRRDLDEFLELCTPDFSFALCLEEVEVGGYEGPEGVRRWWHDTDEAFREIELDVASVEAHDDVALVRGRGSGLGRASGGRLSWPFAQVIRMRDGRMCAWRVFQSPEAAARAAGLPAG